MSLRRFTKTDKHGRAQAMLHEQRLVDAYTRLIRTLVTEMLHNLERHTTVHAMPSAATGWTPPSDDELASLLDVESRLRHAGDEARADAVRDVMRHSLAEFGISFTVRNPLVEHVAAQSATRVTRIAETLRREIADQIDTAWQDGLSIPDTAALLRAAAPTFARTRAETIARTELIGLVNGGSLAAAQMTGAASYKVWLATNDARTRDDHADADGQTVPISDKFEVGPDLLDYPGDPSGSPEEVINCRCTVTYTDSLTAGGEMTDQAARLAVAMNGVDYTLPDEYDTMSFTKLRAALLSLNPSALPDEIDRLCTTLRPGEDEQLVAAASGSTSLQLGARDETWDAGAAEKAMGNDAGQLAAMHFWKDTSDGADPAAKASYKLPFATPENGAHAVWAGVTASAAALQGARGGVAIPSGDVADVKKKIEAYYAKARTKYQDDTITVPWSSDSAKTDNVVPLRAAAAPAGSWTATPLVPYGKLTRDGRMIRSGALSFPAQMPVPLMSSLQDVHGIGDAPPSVLAGSIESFDDTETGMHAAGSIDNTDAGHAALAAAADGRMGISADLAVDEFEMVLPEGLVEDEEGMLILADAGDPSQDVDGGIVVAEGTMEEMGVFVVTKAQVMGCTIVPFAAWDDARIHVTALTADGAPARVSVTMPITVTAAAHDVVMQWDQAAIQKALDLRIATVNEARSLLHLAPVEGGDVYVGVVPYRQDVADMPEVESPMIAALEALAQQQKASSGATAIETLVASMRRDRGDAEKVAVDVVALVKALGDAQRNPELVTALEAMAAAASRTPAPVERTLVVNPPPVTVHTPDVRVENHQPDVHVAAAAAPPRKVMVVRDKDGNAVSYEQVDE